MEDLFKLLMYYSDIFSANKNIAKILKTKLSKAKRKKPRFFQNMPLKLRYHKRPFVILVCTFMEVLFNGLKISSKCFGRMSIGKKIMRHNFLSLICVVFIKPQFVFMGLRFPINLLMSIQEVECTAL